jgi:hypothetical protein
MTQPSNVSTFIAQQRELLDRLERFAETVDFRRLVAVGTRLAGDDVEVWLAEWLIQPAFRLGELPIDTVLRPGGVDVVEAQLVRIAACVVS